MLHSSWRKQPGSSGDDGGRVLHNGVQGSGAHCPWGASFPTPKATWGPWVRGRVLRVQTCRRPGPLFWGHPEAVSFSCQLLYWAEPIPSWDLCPGCAEDLCCSGLWVSHNTFLPGAGTPAALYAVAAARTSSWGPTPRLKTQECAGLFSRGHWLPVSAPWTRATPRLHLQANHPCGHRDSGL